MTVRKINAITRDGGNGRNVYVTVARTGYQHRVTRARTRGGRVQVRLLLTGRWLTLATDDIVKASL